MQGWGKAKLRGDPTSRGNGEGYWGVPAPGHPKTGGAQHPLSRAESVWDGGGQEKGSRSVLGVTDVCVNVYRCNINICMRAYKYKQTSNKYECTTIRM